MKKHLLLTAVVAMSLLGNNKACAQGMAVNTTGSSAAASSMLDVTSTTKGVLIPRLTTVQMNAISSPATGLMIYNTTANSFYYYNGSAWTPVGAGTVTSVSGTTNRVTSTGGATPVIDIDATYDAAVGKVASPLSQFASTTSAQLAGVISNETGSGALVFGTSPSLTTPNLGTPTAAVLTNATGLPLSTGVTGNLPVGNLNSGTGASGSTFWRGDGTWAAPSGGGYAMTMTAQPPGTAGTYYSGLGNGVMVTNAALAFPYPVAKTCTLDVFTATPVAYATYLSGVANVVTGLVLKNGSSTGVTISFTVPNSATVNQVYSNVTDNTHTAVFSPGDILTIQWDQTNAANGALAKFNITMHFSE